MQKHFWEVILLRCWDNYHIFGGFLGWETGIEPRAKGLVANMASEPTKPASSKTSSVSTSVWAFYRHLEALGDRAKMSTRMRQRLRHQRPSVPPHAAAPPPGPPSQNVTQKCDVNV